MSLSACSARISSSRSPMSYPAENIVPSPVMSTHRASRSRIVPSSASRMALPRAPRCGGWEIVSRATAGAGSSTSSLPLLKDHQRVALGHRLAFFAADLGDHARILRLHWHLHLHRLEDHHGVALRDAVADLDLDLPAHTG